jgi:hypothetical protein
MKKKVKRVAAKTKRKGVKKTLAKAVTRKKNVQKKLPPKYKIGEFVYSYHNPTEKRQINAIDQSKKFGVSHKYRLTLSDAQGKPKNSQWIDEKSLSKRKSSN